MPFFFNDKAIRFFKNDGNASFAFFSEIVVANNLGGIHTGDFDGDGDLDLAATSRFGLLSTQPGIVETFFNSDDGTFVQSKQTLTAPIIPGTPEAVDIDGDQDLDIVLSGIGPTDNVISVILIMVTGRFKTKYNTQQTMLVHPEFTWLT